MESGAITGETNRRYLEERERERVVLETLIQRERLRERGRETKKRWRVAPYLEGEGGERSENPSSQRLRAREEGFEREIRCMGVFCLFLVVKLPPKLKETTKLPNSN